SRRRRPGGGGGERAVAWGSPVVGLRAEGSASVGAHPDGDVDGTSSRAAGQGGLARPEYDSDGPGRTRSRPGRGNPVTNDNRTAVVIAVLIGAGAVGAYLWFAADEEPGGGTQLAEP